jgi:hypothetical protein
VTLEGLHTRINTLYLAAALLPPLTAPLMQSPLLSLLRPLGNLERWSAIRHTLGYHNSVTLAIALSPAAAGSLTLENVYAALNNCLAAHAVLSVTIINDTHFARIPRLELSCDFLRCDAGFGGATGGRGIARLWKQWGRYMLADERSPHRTQGVV